MSLRAGPSAPDGTMAVSPRPPPGVCGDALRPAAVLAPVVVTDPAALERLEASVMPLLRTVSDPSLRFATTPVGVRPLRDLLDWLTATDATTTQLASVFQTLLPILMRLVQLAPVSSSGASPSISASASASASAAAEAAAASPTTWHAPVLLVREYAMQCLAAAVERTDLITPLIARSGPQTDASGHALGPAMREALLVQMALVLARGIASPQPLPPPLARPDGLLDRNEALVAAAATVMARCLTGCRSRPATADPLWSPSASEPSLREALAALCAHETRLMWAAWARPAARGRRAIVVASVLDALDPTTPAGAGAAAARDTQRRLLCDVLAPWFTALAAQRPAPPDRTALVLPALPRAASVLARLAVRYAGAAARQSVAVWALEAWHALLAAWLARGGIDAGWLPEAPAPAAAAPDAGLAALASAAEPETADAAFEAMRRKAQHAAVLPAAASEAAASPPATATPSPPPASAADRPFRRSDADVVDQRLLLLFERVKTALDRRQQSDSTTHRRTAAASGLLIDHDEADAAVAADAPRPAADVFAQVVQRWIQLGAVVLVDAARVLPRCAQLFQQQLVVLAGHNHREIRRQAAAVIRDVLAEPPRAAPDDRRAAHAAARRMLLTALAQQLRAIPAGLQGNDAARRDALQKWAALLALPLTATTTSSSAPGADDALHVVADASRAATFVASPLWSSRFADHADALVALLRSPAPMDKTALQHVQTQPAHSALDSLASAQAGLLALHRVAQRDPVRMGTLCRFARLPEIEHELLDRNLAALGRQVPPSVWVDVLRHQLDATIETPFDPRVPASLPAPMAALVVAQLYLGQGLLRGYTRAPEAARTHDDRQSLVGFLQRLLDAGLLNLPMRAPPPPPAARSPSLKPPGGSSGVELDIRRSDAASPLTFPSSSSSSSPYQATSSRASADALQASYMAAWHQTVQIRVLVLETIRLMAAVLTPDEVGLAMMDVLFPVLENVGSSHPTVSAAALRTLEALAAVAPMTDRYGAPATPIEHGDAAVRMNNHEPPRDAAVERMPRLVLDYADYLVNTFSQRLVHVDARHLEGIHALTHTPLAVLRVVTRLAQAPALPLLHDAVLEALGVLDTVHSGPSDVFGTRRGLAAQTARVTDDVWGVLAEMAVAGYAALPAERQCAVLLPEEAAAAPQITGRSRVAADATAVASAPSPVPRGQPPSQTATPFLDALLLKHGATPRPLAVAVDPSLPAPPTVDRSPAAEPAASIDDIEAYFHLDAAARDHAGPSLVNPDGQQADPAATNTDDPASLAEDSPEVLLWQAIMERAAVFLSAELPTTRVAVLHTIRFGLPRFATLPQGGQRHVLALVHQVWAPVKQRLGDADRGVATTALATVATLWQLAPDFLAKRVDQELLPPLHALVQLSFPFPGTAAAGVAAAAMMPSKPRPATYALTTRPPLVARRGPSWQDAARRDLQLLSAVLDLLETMLAPMTAAARAIGQARPAAVGAPPLPPASLEGLLRVLLPVLDLGALGVTAALARDAPRDPRVATCRRAVRLVWRLAAWVPDAAWCLVYGGLLEGRLSDVDADADADAGAGAGADAGARVDAAGRRRATAASGFPAEYAAAWRDLRPGALPLARHLLRHLQAV